MACFVNFYFLETQHKNCTDPADLSKGRGRRPHIPTCCFPHGESASNCEVQSLIRCTYEILRLHIVYNVYLHARISDPNSELYNRKGLHKNKKIKAKTGENMHTVNIINSKHLYISRIFKENTETRNICNPKR